MHPEPRKELSPYAPKMLQMQIDVDKIREVIGKAIPSCRRLSKETGAKIDIEEDGRIFISSTDIEACRRRQI